MEELSDKIKEILKGIDQNECESNDGWWPTSTGAEFGEERLRLVLEAIELYLNQKRNDNTRVF